MDTTENIEIRLAGAGDAVLISILASTTFYEAYFEQDESENLARYISDSFEFRRIAAELDDPAVVFPLIFVKGKAVGYAKLDKSSSLECVKSMNCVELQRIYVVERLYGSGAGTALLNHCLSLAKSSGFDKLWLQVWEENPRARRFYEKHGFEPVGKIEVPYGDVIGTNLVMAKAL